MSDKAQETAKRSEVTVTTAATTGHPSNGPSGIKSLTPLPNPPSSGASTGTPTQPPSLSANGNAAAAYIRLTPGVFPSSSVIRTTTGETVVTATKAKAAPISRPAMDQQQPINGPAQQRPPQQQFSQPQIRGMPAPQQLHMQHPQQLQQLQQPQQSIVITQQLAQQRVVGQRQVTNTAGNPVQARQPTLARMQQGPPIHALRTSQGGFQLNLPQGLSQGNAQMINLNGVYHLVYNKDGRALASPVIGLQPQQVQPAPTNPVLVNLPPNANLQQGQMNVGHAIPMAAHPMGQRPDGGTGDGHGVLNAKNLELRNMQKMPADEKVAGWIETSQPQSLSDPPSIANGDSNNSDDKESNKRIHDSDVEEDDHIDDTIPLLDQQTNEQTENIESMNPREVREHGIFMGDAAASNIKRLGQRSTKKKFIEHVVRGHIIEESDHPIGVHPMGDSDFEDYMSETDQEASDEDFNGGGRFRTNGVSIPAVNRPRTGSSFNKEIAKAMKQNVKENEHKGDETAKTEVAEQFIKNVKGLKKKIEEEEVDTKNKKKRRRRTEIDGIVNMDFGPKEQKNRNEQLVHVWNTIDETKRETRRTTMTSPTQDKPETTTRKRRSARMSSEKPSEPAKAESEEKEASSHPPQNSSAVNQGRFYCRNCGDRNNKGIIKEGTPGKQYCSDTCRFTYEKRRDKEARQERGEMVEDDDDEEGSIEITPPEQEAPAIKVEPPVTPTKRTPKAVKTEVSSAKKDSEPTETAKRKRGARSKESSEAPKEDKRPKKEETPLEKTVTPTKTTAGPEKKPTPQKQSPEKPKASPVVEKPKPVVVEPPPPTPPPQQMPSTSTAPAIQVPTASSDGIPPEDPKNWTVTQVGAWILTFPGSSEEISKKFVDEQIDGEALAQLTKVDLREDLKLPLGLCMNIPKRFNQLRAESGATASSSDV